MENIFLVVSLTTLLIGAFYFYSKKNIKSEKIDAERTNIGKSFLGFISSEVSESLLPINTSINISKKYKVLFVDFSSGKENLNYLNIENYKNKSVINTIYKNIYYISLKKEDISDLDSVLKSNNNLFDIFIFNVPQTLTNEAELINKIDKINIFTRLNKDSISELSNTLGNLEKLNFSERQKITEIIINDYDSQDQWQKSLLAFVEEYYPNLITEKISKKTGDFNQELFFERLAKKLENQLELLV